MKHYFKENIWIETGSAWGNCVDFATLKEKLDLILKDSPEIGKYENILDRLSQNKDFLNFGLKREHIGGKPFSEYLKETEQYDDLIKYLENEINK